jgi:hypothetical protein
MGIFANSIPTFSPRVLAFLFIRLHPRHALRGGRSPEEASGDELVGDPVNAENGVAPGLANNCRDLKTHEFCFGGKEAHTTSSPPKIYLVRRKREE